MNKMGQANILVFLSEHPTRWMTSTQITEEGKTGNKSSVTMNLKKLRKDDLVLFKKERLGNSGMASYLYKHKKED